MSFEEQIINESIIKERTVGWKKKTGRYKNICFEGGGVRGISIVGALQELHKRRLLSGITNFAGSSAGSIVAAILACGASFNFLYHELSNMNFDSFLDYGNKIKAVYNLYYYYGACPGLVLSQWIEKTIEKLTGNANITLLEVHKKYGGKLIITGTSLTKRKITYFSYKDHPNMMLKTAIRISTSIPLVFMPVEYSGELWCDGGVLDNFPIRAFHRETESDDYIESQTIGIMLMSTSEDNKPTPLTNLYDIVYSVISCFLNQTQKMYIDPQDWHNSIKIQCGALSSLDFKLDEDQKKQLVEKGEQAVITYFEKHPLVSSDLSDLSDLNKLTDAPSDVLLNQLNTQQTADSLVTIVH
jgi:NTE family protein